MPLLLRFERLKFDDTKDNSGVIRDTLNQKGEGKDINFGNACVVGKIKREERDGKQGG